MVFSKNGTYNRKYVMKSIKTNPNGNCKQIVLHIIDNTWVDLIIFFFEKNRHEVHYFPEKKEYISKYDSAEKRYKIMLTCWKME
jgi:hypothetical protein